MSHMHDPSQVPGDDEIDTVPYIDHDEAQWVEQLKAMDNTAWDDLLRHHSGDLRQSVVRLLHKYHLPAHWCDDVEQEIWRTAVRRIGDFVWEGEGKLYGWLYSIALNHIRNLSRKKGRYNESFDEVDANADETGLTLDFYLYANGITTESAESRAEMREMLAALDGAMHKMKPRDREILTRRLILQQTPREIAAIYGLKPATVSMILFRGKEFIRVQMTAADFRRQEGN